MTTVQARHEGESGGERESESEGESGSESERGSGSESERESGRARAARQASRGGRRPKGMEKSALQGERSREDGAPSATVTNLRFGMIVCEHALEPGRS